jgi:hypothetical protein
MEAVMLPPTDNRSHDIHMQQDLRLMERLVASQPYQQLMPLQPFKIHTACQPDSLPGSRRPAFTHMQPEHSPDTRNLASQQHDSLLLAAPVLSQHCTGMQAIVSKGANWRGLRPTKDDVDCPSSDQDSNRRYHSKRLHQATRPY